MDMEDSMTKTKQITISDLLKMFLQHIKLIIIFVVLGAVIALLGIGMVAIPTGILSSGFMEHLAKRDQADVDKQVDAKDSDDDIKYCPHCGKKLK